MKNVKLFPFCLLLLGNIHAKAPAQNMYDEQQIKCLMADHLLLRTQLGGSMILGDLTRTANNPQACKENSQELSKTSKSLQALTLYIAKHNCAESVARLYSADIGDKIFNELQ